MATARQHINLARSLRHDATDAEKRLWSRLRRNSIGWHFRRQHPVPPYVLDFAYPSLGISVEADSGQDSVPGEHAARDTFLTRQGWAMLRFWNNEVLANTDGVMAVIRAACQERAARQPPTPPSLASRARG